MPGQGERKKSIQLKDLRGASHEGEILDQVSLTLNQALNKVVTAPLYYAFGTSSQGIKQAERLPTVSASDRADESFVAEWQEARRQWDNDKLGFSAVPFNCALHGQDNATIAKQIICVLRV